MHFHSWICLGHYPMAQRAVFWKCNEVTRINPNVFKADLSLSPHTLPPSVTWLFPSCLPHSCHICLLHPLPMAACYYHAHCIPWDSQSLLLPLVTAPLKCNLSWSFPPGVYLGMLACFFLASSHFKIMLLMDWHNSWMSIFLYENVGFLAWRLGLCFTSIKNIS